MNTWGTLVFLISCHHNMICSYYVHNLIKPFFRTFWKFILKHVDCLQEFSEAIFFLIIRIQFYCYLSCGHFCMVLAWVFGLSHKDIKCIDFFKKKSFCKWQSLSFFHFKVSKLVYCTTSLYAINQGVTYFCNEITQSQVLTKCYSVLQNTVHTSTKGTLLKVYNKLSTVIKCFKN